MTETNQKHGASVKLTGAEAVVKSLGINGVDTVFGLPGAQLDDLFDAFYREKDAIRLIHTRHEQGAAYMAFGYAQSTGRLGTCSVVPGPGLLNAGAGLLTAHGCSAPVLAMVGQIPSRFIDKGYGQLHEIADQMGMARAFTKWQARIEAPSEAPQLVNEAIEQAMSGRKRPVMLEMAPDIMAARADIAFLNRAADDLDPAPDEDLIEQAASMLGNAENPVITVGGGIFGAENELAQLSEMIGAPVIMTANGQGAIDARKPAAQNIVSGKGLYADADVVLAVGTRLMTPMMTWKGFEGKKLIRIEIDPAQPTAPWEPNILIRSTAQKALTALRDRIGRHNRIRVPVAEEWISRKEKAAELIAEKMGPQDAYAKVIRRELPEDGIACFGVTQMGFYAWFGFPFYQPRTSIQSGLQGTLGYSFATALGAKVAHPDRQVVCISGDGGIMFTIAELATAVRHNINLVTIVFNDGAYGNVRRNQKIHFGERYIGSDLHNPDFVRLAESFGAVGMRVESPEQLGVALRKAFDADAPVLIDAVVGEMPPWQPVLFGKSTRPGAG